MSRDKKTHVLQLVQRWQERLAWGVKAGSVLHQGRGFNAAVTLELVRLQLITHVHNLHAVWQ